MDVQKTIDFILEQQAHAAAMGARFEERLAEINESLAATNRTIDRVSNRLDRATRMGVEEVRRERRRRQQLADKVQQLAEAQARTEQMLQSFIESLKRAGNGHN